MRDTTKQLRNPRKSIVRVENCMGGLRVTGTRYDLPRNSYTDCLNIVLTERGGFKRRKTAKQLGTEPTTSNTRISGYHYHKTFGWIRVKNGVLQTLANENATWSDTGISISVSSKNQVYFASFKATSLTVSETKTLKEISSERFVIVNEAMTPNALVGKMLKIGSEIKMIVGNTSDVIYIMEKFQSTYSASTSLQIVDQVDAVYIATPGNNMIVWRGGSNFATLSFGFHNIVVQSYGPMNNNGRLLGIRNDSKVYVSEVGTGEFFQTDSFIPVSLQGDLTGISEINGKVVVYATYGRANIIGDTPDNYQVIPTLSYKGTIAPGSIASGNNIEFYLSHEGIEYLQSIENATVTEGMSISDNIKRIFEKHTDFTGTVAAISNGKYFLSIQDTVYIYDIELSVKFHKAVFTLAKYTECSQAVVPSAVAGEWTCAGEVQGQLVFAQGGKMYRVTDEKIGPNDTQSLLSYMIEFPIETMGDMRVDKVIKRYGVYFQNDKNANVNDTKTRIRVYFSYNEGSYTLAREVENIYDLQVYLSQRAKSSRFKLEITDVGTVADTEFEFLYSELEFIPYGIK